MKDWKYFLIAGTFLILTSTGKTLDNVVKKKVQGKLEIITSLFYCILGGSIAGVIAWVHIETVQIQWVCISVGSFMGERLLERVAEAFEEKIDLIFNKTNEDES